MRHLLTSALILAVASCAPATVPEDAAPAISDEDLAFLDDLQQRTFRWFWDYTNPENGLVPDRAPSMPFSSIAAVGFGLTAYPVGVERGFVTREDAADRTLATLRFFWNAPQGEAAEGMTGNHGFFYHFLHMDTGTRFQTNELSTIDTALLMGGVLMAMEYYDGDSPVETEIRALADSLYRRVEWDWFINDRNLITMAWRPERGKGPAAYQGYDEAMLLYVLALGSPTHPVSPEVWDAFTSTYEWADFYGYEHVNFAPLFGHQYSHVWIDFRGIQDAYMRGRGIDYFENSRRATLSQREYGQDNPSGFRDYSENIWGWTASDGPANLRLPVDGDTVQFHTYFARGVAAGDIRDDGTIVPTAAGGSIPFAPEVTIAALRNMRQRYGDLVYDEHGFVDAFNPTFRFQDQGIERGVVDPEHGWFDGDKLGIDQGPILIMAENFRTGLVWQYMRENEYIVRGLCRAGFEGGWLEGRCG
ncbi:MAG TPA: glucoamylase family protein [Rhodothermales bacterium]